MKMTILIHTIAGVYFMTCWFHDLVTLRYNYKAIRVKLSLIGDGYQCGSGPFEDLVGIQGIGDWPLFF